MIYVKSTHKKKKINKYKNKQKDVKLTQKKWKTKISITDENIIYYTHKKLFNIWIAK